MRELDRHLEKGRVVEKCIDAVEAHNGNEADAREKNRCARHAASASATQDREVRPHQDKPAVDAQVARFKRELDRLRRINRGKARNVFSEERFARKRRPAEKVRVAGTLRSDAKADGVEFVFDRPGRKQKDDDEQAQKAGGEPG